MAISGHQDWWVPGHRMYFEREAQDSVLQPFVDLGVCQGTTPTITPTNIDLIDGDGGVRRIVDSALSEITETYDVVISNCNLRNLAIAMLANDPSTFTQAATEQDVSQWAIPEELLKVLDSSGVAIFNLSAVAGVYTGVVEVKVIESITVSTKIIKLTGDQTAEAGLAAGKSIIVNGAGLANIANSRSYTVVSAVLNATKTDVTVVEEPAANETAITGVLTIENGGTIYEQDVDWEVYNLGRGIIRFLPSPGSFAVAANVNVVFTPAALTGRRLVNPQQLRGIARGTAWLVWGRGNNAQQTAREMLCTISPSGISLPNADDYANLTLQVKVLNDLTSATPAGRLLQFMGSLPTNS